MATKHYCDRCGLEATSPREVVDGAYVFKRSGILASPLTMDEDVEVALAEAIVCTECELALGDAIAEWWRSGRTSGRQRRAKK